MIIGCRPPGLFASYFPLASLAVDKRKQEVHGKQVRVFLLVGHSGVSVVHHQAKYPTAGSSVDGI